VTAGLTDMASINPLASALGSSGDIEDLERSLTFNVCRSLASSHSSCRVISIRLDILPPTASAFAESFFDSPNDFEAGGVLGCQTDASIYTRAVVTA
jgi:hypothetical protein